jgi:hypothetical protein
MLQQFNALLVLPNTIWLLTTSLVNHALPNALFAQVLLSAQVVILVTNTMQLIILASVDRVVRHVFQHRLTIYV